MVAIRVLNQDPKVLPPEMFTQFESANRCDSPLLVCQPTGADGSYTAQMAAAVQAVSLKDSLARSPLSGEGSRVSMACTHGEGRLQSKAMDAVLLRVPASVSDTEAETAKG